ncbi:MAG: hypothetical protein IKY66_03310 [Bacteroidales bacterium]|nr:hypothetical protein [Bacteroidales bacterium]
MNSNAKQLAESILKEAALTAGGHCYPSSVSTNDADLLIEALDLLTPYGTTSYQCNGAAPIFTINDIGRIFAQSGAWSEKERMERIAAERHTEQMSAMKQNNKLVKWSIFATILIGAITAILTFISAL